MLSRALIDTNRLCTKRTTSTVCYFFFKTGDTSRIRGANALCAILHQLFWNNPHHGLIRRALESHRKLERSLQGAFSELWRILTDCAEQKAAGEIICVLDALDECEDREEMIDTLVQFYSESKYQSISSSTLKFLITSRPYDDLDAGFKRLTKISTYMHFDGDDKSDTIRKEINLVIDAKIQEIQETAGSFEKKACDQILSRLKSKDNRTYLWLCLIFDIIAKSRSAYSKPSSLQNLLDELPLGLDGAYEAILNRSQNKGQAKLLLQIVLAATRPLTLDEVNTALTLTIRDEREGRFSSLDELYGDRWQPGNFKMIVTNLCGLFISVYDSKLFFIHQTAREFLTEGNESYNSTSNGWKGWKGCLNIQTAHEKISRACLSYLSMSPAILHLGAEPALMVKPLTFRLYAALNWPFHYVSQGDSGAQKSTTDARMLCNTAQQAEHWLAVYCERNYLKRTEWTNLSLASYIGLSQVVEEILKFENPDINAQGGEYGTAVQAASAAGHGAIVTLLLEKGANVNAKGGAYDYALQAASAGGHNAIVALLLEKGADVNAKGGFYNTALQAASAGGHNTIVELLLEKDADVNAKGGIYNTALQAASAGGHNTIVTLLLEREVDVNAKAGVCGYALQAASARGYNTVVTLLLEKGADINAQGESYGTALYVASAGGHNTTVTLLLEKGADINVHGGYYGTALQAASARGHYATVTLLLEKGADINAQGGHCNSWYCQRAAGGITIQQSKRHGGLAVGSRR